MNQPKLEELFDNIYEAVERIHQIYKPEYDLARYNIRMAKLDHSLLDVLTDADMKQLSKLEREVRIKHKDYCDSIIHVRNVIEQAINAMDNFDGQDIDKKRQGELEVILNELPNCPPESDFLNITDIEDDSLNMNDDDDDDDEIILSDSSDVDDEPIDNYEARNNSLFEKVIEKSKHLKNIENELKKFDELKSQSKSEMFKLRDQQLDVTKHQRYQRDLFNKMNELKINYRRAKAEIKEMIQDILPYLNDDTIGRELMELLHKIEKDDAIDKSQVHHETRIPQASSRIPERSQAPQVSRIQRPSNIPRISIERPQTPTKIPQIYLKPPQVSFNQSQIPQLSKIQPDQILSQSHQQQSQIPRRPTSQGYQISRQISSSKIPIKPTIHQDDVERQRNAQVMTSKIPQFGNISNIRQPSKNHAQTIPQGRNKQFTANLKISESIGNVRKVKARPLNEATSNVKNTNIRANDEVNRLHLRNLTAAQRSNLNKQNKIKAEDSVGRMLEAVDKNLVKFISKWSAEDREKYEKKDIQQLIESSLKMFFNELENENFSHESKMKALERKLKLMLDEVSRIMTQNRGKYFTPDEPANQQFVESVLKHFNETKNFENYRETLAEFFKNIPYKKFKTLKQPPKAAQKKQLIHSTPTIYGRPSTARRYNNLTRNTTSLQRRPSTSGVTKNAKTKVETQLKKLENTSLHKSSTQAAIKYKLEKFVDTFCKLFILNQKNRRNKFEIWVKMFRDNLNPILNQLDAFYKSLPYPEMKKFNRSQVEQSLDHLLRQVYEQTRKYELNNVKCKDLIGNEMKKLMEQKQLKNLNASLGIFLQGIKELIDPYVVSETQQHSSSVMQKSQQSIHHRGHQSMLQRLHESNIQKALHRTLMNDTDDSVEYPSFNESLLQQVSVPELQTMYKKMMRGKYQIPNVQGTANQAMMLEKIEKILRKKAQRGMAKKRDESFLQAHGKADQMTEFPIHERIAPSSINIFKRVIGANVALKSIETTDEILKALDIILECCEIIDDNIIKVLMTQHRNEISALEESVNALVAHIKNLVYNNNEIDYADELARLDKLHYKVDVDELKSKLGRKIFTKSECENLLENAFSIQVNENDDAAYTVVEFIKNLRYLQYKYILKLLKGEIRGYTDKSPSMAVSSHDDLSSTMPSTSYLDRIKTVHPIRVVKDYNYPRDLIERDILYVACQLTNQNELETGEDENDDDDRNDFMDYLSRFVIQIAQKFQNNSINERDALRIVGQIFYMLPCIPISFYQRFIYHADNEYFSAIRFNNPSLNTAARIETMAMKNRTMCAEDKLLYGRQITLITDQIERFMFVFDNEIEEIAHSFRMLDMREQNNIKISGNELSNNGNGVLGNPKAINTKNAIDGKIDNVQLSLVSGKAPIANVATDDILTKLNEIEAVLDKQLNEIDHFENSKVAKNSMKYQLQPNAINRKNYWQCRGTEIPKWFPGFYTIFPYTNLSKPIAYSIEQILPHAWRMMAPINYK